MVNYDQFRSGLRFLPTLEFSPDGAWIAYVDDAGGQFNVVVQASDGGPARRLTDFTDHTVRRVTWHPTGKSVILLADANGTENAQIFQQDLAGGPAEPITDDAAVRYGLTLGTPFDPGGSQLAYYASDGANPGFDTLILDLQTGTSRRPYAGGGRTYPGYWSPDGTQLSLVRYLKGYDQSVLVLPALGGEPREISPAVPGGVWELGPWLPDGKSVLVRSDHGREFLGLAALDVTNGAISWLDTPDWDVEDVLLSMDGRILVWAVNVDGESQLRARNLSTGADLQLPAAPGGRVRAMTLSPDGTRLALLLSSATRPWNILIIELNGGASRWLTQELPPAAAAVRMVEPELIHYSSLDGRPLSAYLYRPAEHSEPVGVLISVHGGPVFQERPVYDGLYQYLLSQGIAVMAPNIRGSSGYGKAHQALVSRDWGGGDLMDIEATAGFLRQQSWADATKLGLYGNSYGGFIVLSAISRLPEFDWAAAVELFGPSNLITLARATPPAFLPLIKEMIGHPDEDADFLRRRSPVTFANQIRTPLFVLQGANDIRVPQSESDQLVEALRARGVEVRYDVYPDEGHGFMRAGNEAEAIRNTAQFFVDRLGPRPVD